MAGIETPRKGWTCITNIYSETKYLLNYFKPAEITAKENFGLVLGSWDLKTCNNHLVAFIDRARVLAEAYEIKGSLPSTL